jgi:hypothetical protein
MARGKGKLLSQVERKIKHHSECLKDWKGVALGNQGCQY